MVVSCKCKAESDTEALDCHDGDGACCTAYRDVNEGVLAAVFWCDSVDHDYREDCDEQTVEEESYTAQSVMLQASLWIVEFYTPGCKA